MQRATHTNHPLPTTMPPAVDAAECVACGAAYRRCDAGELACRAHTLGIDYETGHYRCCGLAPNGAPCRVHAESARAPPYGCHRVDHCATTEERARILEERPFVVAPLDEARALMEYGARADDVRVFHVTSEEQLTGALDIATPRLWRGTPDGAAGSLSVDLRAEHDALRAAVSDRAADPYEAEWTRGMADAPASAASSFVPFALIVRIDAVPNAAAVARGARACIWTD